MAVDGLRGSLFTAGLALRVALVVLVVPQTYGEWFVPFLASVAAGGGLDFWTAHLGRGGNPFAFPYGPVYVVMLAPAVLLGALADSILGKSGGAVGLGFAVLLYDYLLYAALNRLVPEKPGQVLALYWLSPIVIYICYWHGQLDIVPVLLMVFSLVLMSRLRVAASGTMIGLAMAAKLSMAAAAPFVLVYLANSNRLRGLAPRYAAAGAAVAALVMGPYLLSDGFRSMVLQTPQMDKLYAMAITLGGGLNIYLIPLVYLVVLFVAWRIGRISFDLLLALLGIGFFVLLLLTPASPGWFLWVMPFLVNYQTKSGLTGKVLMAIFTVLYVALNLLEASGAAIPLLGVDLRSPVIGSLPAASERVPSLILSLMVATGAMLGYQMAREGILHNDYYILSRRPLAIGIAGDSGTGKDTLADSIEGLFGAHSVARISGDDYHNWDRRQPMWKVLTHLNPQANDLYQFNQDVVQLMAGRSVRNRHYDHATGHSSKPRLIHRNDVVVASGLHALYSPELNRHYDLRVFLDMHPALRRYLKARRDIEERGASQETVIASLEKREPDGAHFVSPQAKAADLVLSLHPLHPDLLRDAGGGRDPTLKLRILMPTGAHYEQLVRSLIAVCGMHVEILMHKDSGGVEIWVEGEADAEDIAVSAAALVPQLDELLDLRPKWRAGVSGVMQLFVLTQAVRALQERRL